MTVTYYLGDAPAPGIYPNGSHTSFLYPPTSPRTLEFVNGRYTTADPDEQSFLGSLSQCVSQAERDAAYGHFKPAPEFGPYGLRS
jgi:hypothetical protein